ncbi:MAG: DNA topoisomerase I [Thermoplasmata archaeon]|nr:DNA topoisomerase I [Thermoplasmata archaeon]
MRKLIISEKNHAAMRIATILSDGKASRKNISGIQIFQFERPNEFFSIIGLRGHLVALDYPKEYNDWHSTDISELINVDPIKIIDASSKKIVGGLRKLASDSDEIIIATDYDREGELIGVESLEELDWKKPVKRAKFSALTKTEVLDAFKNTSEVDFKLAAAAETRQIIDLKWGAALTRFLSTTTGQTGRDFLSVGRVQSPTLALIVDREREIESFVPMKFWEIIADLAKQEPSADIFHAIHSHGKFDDKEKAHQIIERIKSSKTGTVLSYSAEERNEYPPHPFNTTQFLAEASKLGMSASHAMRVAEDLYTDGYISYPRTDNTVYPKSLSLRQILKNLEATEFGEYARKILAMDSLRPSRGRTITTDHPPIHPTSPATRDELKGNKWTIYELVCRRFLATLSPSSIVEIQNSEIKIADELFNAHGRKMIAQGWREIYTYWKFDGKPLPLLSNDEVVDVKHLRTKEEETKPPARYSQGTLIQEMERKGLGTKSTRHEIIQKLYDRKFVHGSRLRPTPIGMAVIVALENHAREVTDEKMTATLEKDMDLIAKGGQTQDEVIEESQAMLEDVVKVLKKNKDAIAADIKIALSKQKYLGKCPTCGKGEMTLIRMRGGKRFIGCSGYPDCKTAFPVPAMGHIEPTGEACPECKAPKVIVPERGKKAGSICINPKCPSRMKHSKIGICPNCGSGLHIVYSARGKRFLGCEGYPKCRTTYPLPQKGGIVATEENCETCKAPIIKVVSKGRRPWTLCVNIECPSKKKPAEEAKNSEKDNKNE